MPLVDLRQQAIHRNPQQMLAHLQSFNLDLKFSAGIWFFSPSSSRFHDKYSDEQSIEQRLELRGDTGRVWAERARSPLSERDQRRQPPSLEATHGRHRHQADHRDPASFLGRSL